jgi:hypothetical protein
VGFLMDGGRGLVEGGEEWTTYCSTGAGIVVWRETTVLRLVLD